MACSTCKHVEIVEPEKSGLQYSLAYGVTTVEGLLGKVYSLKTPLIPKPHTPRGGWGVSLYVYGHANPITGSSASVVFAKCSEFLTLNGFAHTDLDLWFNLNIQWVSAAISKYQQVPLESLLSLGTPNY